MEESAESPNPEAVEAPIFMVPEGDPPALTPRAVSRRSSDGGLSMSSCPHSSFGEILGQIQVGKCLIVTEPLNPCACSGKNYERDNF